MSAFAGLLQRVTGLGGPRVLPASGSPAHSRGRQVTPLAHSVTRWQHDDVEAAIHDADAGNLQRAAQLCAALRRDGTIAGVLSTRTEGLIQLPVRYSGDEEMAERLEGEFRCVVPAAEAALLAGDGILLGVGVGELVEEPGSDVMTFRRLNPEYLIYRWSEDRWYYRSVGGLLPITPGDGRWVLHTPGGHQSPWQSGLWMALGRAYISKDHAFFYRENYSGKLANPARVAVSPAGSSANARAGFFRKIARWGVNTVFDLPQGWDVRILESNGRGFEIFEATIKTCDQEIQVVLAGQSVSTDGGKAFTSTKIFQTIRYDLIQATADRLAETINRQIIPQWANQRFGWKGVLAAPSIGWDVTPPADLIATAQLIAQFSSAVLAANAALAPYGRQIDAIGMARGFGFKLLSPEESAAVLAAAAKMAPSNDAAPQAPSVPAVSEAA
jgi:hypothetical protein